MKLSISADELEQFEAMDDETLTKTIRDSLAAFRAGRAADEPVRGDPSSAAHGGRSVATIETVGSQRANISANDAVRSAARLRANDTRLTPADRAAARIVADDYSAQSARDKAHAKIVPGIDRL